MLLIQHLERILKFDIFCIIAKQQQCRWCVACKKYALLEEPVRPHTARALAARPRRHLRARPRLAARHSPTFTFGPDNSYTYYINNYHPAECHPLYCSPSTRYLTLRRSFFKNPLPRVSIGRCSARGLPVLIINILPTIYSITLYINYCNSISELYIF